MINTLVLCEGKNDLNFLRGMVENLGKDPDKIKFIEGPAQIESHIRSGYYSSIFLSNGGKGDLPKYAKNMISRFRSENGNLKIIYIKDKVAGNQIAENLMSNIDEFLGNSGKFIQYKPEVSSEGEMIHVAFKGIKLTYHIVGIDVSLENQVWKKLKEESQRCIEINRKYDDDHEKLHTYCLQKSISMEELMKGAYAYFDEDDEWYMEIRDLLDELL